MPGLLLYGATGYTGALAAAQAKTKGLNFTLAGRTEAKLKDLANRLDADYKVFDLDDDTLLDINIAKFQVLLNCAGPFLKTAEPLMEACIRNKVHYLDVSAELISYQLAEKLDEEAREAGVMLMPGAGGSVAMFSCLAGFALQGEEDTLSIDVALHVSGSMSRGSAMSASQSVTSSVLERRDGELIERSSIKTASFDFQDGKGPVDCFPVTLPDLITLGNSTNVSSLRCFVHASDTAFPQGDPENLPDGPDLEERWKSPYHAVARITSRDGIPKAAVLHTVNGYSFTSIASVEAAIRVTHGNASAGFHTPAEVFGVDFVRSVVGSEMSTV